MQETKSRKEISLDSQTLAILQLQADKEGRKLKNYMESVLNEKAKNFELTDEYKSLMDEILKKHGNNEVEYSNWDDFKVEISE